MPSKSIAVVIWLCFVFTTSAGCGSGKYDEKLEQRVQELKSQEAADGDSSDDNNTGNGGDDGAQGGDSENGIGDESI